MTLPGPEDTPSVHAPRLVLVTGPSGAGRSTAIKVLEDIGFEAIDNLPLSLLPRLMDGPPLTQSLALGVDVRNRDFSIDGIIEMAETLAQNAEFDTDLLYLDARADVLIRRFSETRRRHPFAPSETPTVGVERELEQLAAIRTRATILVDTSDLTVHDLRDEILRVFRPDAEQSLSVSVQSFSYKRGLPRGVDLVFDVRFLANPHWRQDLRPHDGRSPEVTGFVESDPKFAEFFERTSDLLRFLLPAYREEGKTHLAVGFGCTGGKHRSVALAEKTAKLLAEEGWQVSIRHRELEQPGGMLTPQPKGPVA
ncbi:MAG: RNase adapter RapZ [Rhodobacteraceae bacterium]|nr:RNase adapter RapZ [Paracoccaceae bacterium]